jgi:hypothetical protein
MPKGNSDHFGRDSINAGNGGYDDDYGPADFGSIDARANARKWNKEQKVGDIETPLDRPVRASYERAERSSDSECLPSDERYIYGGPNGRKG